MTELSTVVEAQHTLEEALMQKMAQFDSQLQAAMVAPQSAASVTRLHEDFSTFKTLVHSIMNLLRQQIHECSKSLDVIEMRHRRKYLLLGGVPEDIQNCTEHIATLFRDKLGIQDAAADKLKVCHRLGKLVEGRCRPVVLRFTDLSMKSAIWRKKSGLKGTPLVLSEFLTRQRQALFVNARKRVGIRNCWTLDGNVFIKLQDGSRQRITAEEELLKLPITTTNPVSDKAQGRPLPCPSQPSASGSQQTKPLRAARLRK